MIAIGATEVRKNWSSICDKVSRECPEIIKRTHDLMFLASQSDMLDILSCVQYNISVFTEDDGSITVVSDSMDLAENAETRETALNALASAILDYARDYYADFRMYNNAPNRKAHLPFVTKAILLDSEEKIMEDFVCRDGES